MQILFSFFFSRALDKVVNLWPRLSAVKEARTCQTAQCFIASVRVCVWVGGHCLFDRQRAASVITAVGGELKTSFIPHHLSLALFPFSLLPCFLSVHQ